MKPAQMNSVMFKPSNLSADASMLDTGGRPTLPTFAVVSGAARHNVGDPHREAALFMLRIGSVHRMNAPKLLSRKRRLGFRGVEHQYEQHQRQRR